MLSHYTVWSDAFWNSIGHGMSEQEAEKHAAEKAAAFDKAQASRRRDAAQRAQDHTPDELGTTYHDYLEY